VTLFRIFALALPVAAGLLVPALLAWKRDWRAPAYGFAALAVPALLLGLASGTGIASSFAVVTFSAAFAALALGAFMLGGQVLSGLLVAALSIALTLMGPWVKDAIARNDATAIEARLSMVLAADPAIAMSYSIFNIDVLRSPGHYGSSFSDFLVQAPSWRSTAMGYVAAGALLAGLGFARRRSLKLPE